MFSRVETLSSLCHRLYFPAKCPKDASICAIHRVSNYSNAKERARKDFRVIRARTRNWKLDKSRTTMTWSRKHRSFRILQSNRKRSFENWHKRAASEADITILWRSDKSWWIIARFIEEAAFFVKHFVSHSLAHTVELFRVWETRLPLTKLLLAPCIPCISVYVCSVRGSSYTATNQSNRKYRRSLENAL